MRSLVIATANAGNASNAAVLDDLDLLARYGAQVICLQETGDRRSVLERFVRTHRGWRLWAGRVPGAPSVAILYRVPVRKRRSRVAVPRMYVGAGAGPRWAKAKAVTMLLTGRLWILDTHKIASATRKGKRYSLRRVHYRLHQAALLAMTATRPGPMVVVGDFNAEWNHPLLRRMRRKFNQHVRFPTKDGRTIDLVWSRKCRVTNVERVKTSSDHFAVLFTVTY